MTGSAPQSPESSAATVLPPLRRADIAAWLIAALALILVIKLKLLSSLLAGLLVFKLVDVLTPWLRLRALGHDGPRVLAVTLIAGAVIAALVGIGVGLVALMRHSGESVPLLMQKMAQIIEDARAILPDGLRGYVPDNADTLQRTLAEWLRSNSASLQLAGRGIGRTVVHVLMGMVIGALLSMQKATSPHERRPLTEEIARHAGRLATAFQRVVFAQFWISLINTAFTWLYLDVVLRLFGVDLPLVKTLVALTFVVGLLPIAGNLISNTAIVVVCLSQGVPVALASLVYLIAIHKLEYFLNARIIGSHINARAWELLIAMLAMEAAFGVPGLIAAPIFYAYFKEELRAKALI
jgi:predicted PurR-regulated permease PerM